MQRYICMLPLPVILEHLHQRRQVAGGGGAAGSDRRVRSRGDLPGCPSVRGSHPGLCAACREAQSPAGHVCCLSHARQGGLYSRSFLLCCFCFMNHHLTKKKKKKRFGAYLKHVFIHYIGRVPCKKYIYGVHSCTQYYLVCLMCVCVCV